MQSETAYFLWLLFRWNEFCADKNFFLIFFLIQLIYTTVLDYDGNWNLL